MSASAGGKPRMDFLDGNNPAADPNAIVLYPSPDPDFIFDSATKSAVDLVTGERLTLTIRDREYRRFIATIRRPGQDDIEMHGFIGQLDKQGVGLTPAYNITQTRIVTDGRPSPVDYPINRAGKFLTAYASALGPHRYTGHITVIDNRRPVGGANDGT